MRSVVLSSQLKADRQDAWGRVKAAEERLEKLASEMTGVVAQRDVYEEALKAFRAAEAAGGGEEGMKVLRTQLKQWAEEQRECRVKVSEHTIMSQSDFWASVMRPVMVLF